MRLKHFKICRKHDDAGTTVATRLLWCGSMLQREDIEGGRDGVEMLSWRVVAARCAGGTGDGRRRSLCIVVGDRIPIG